MGHRKNPAVIACNCGSYGIIKPGETKGNCKKCGNQVLRMDISNRIPYEKDKCERRMGVLIVVHGKKHCTKKSCSLPNCQYNTKKLHIQETNIQEVK
ncbi:MAG: hypothetical protein ACP5OG_05965 [Candidatus Nanoarchaeia archaeon]